MVNFPLYIITLYIMSISCSCYFFWFEVYFVWCECNKSCFLYTAISLEYHLPSFHFSQLPSLELSFPSVIYNSVLFLVHPTRLHLLIEFNSFLFMVKIDKWGLSTAILSFLFSGCSRSTFFSFFFFSATTDSWFSLMFLSFFSFFFSILCLFSRFVICLNHKICRKCLFGKIELFSVIASYLHYPVWFSSFSSSNSMFFCFWSCILLWIFD